MLARNVAAVQRERFCLDILYEPDGVVGLPQRLDDRLANGQIRFRLLAFLGDIRQKDIGHAAIHIRLRAMSVVLDPAHHPILAHDAVFDVVVGLVARADLLLDGCAGGLVIVGMHEPPELPARQLSEFIGVFAAEYREDGIVGIQDIAALDIDEKPARHMAAQCRDDGKRLLVQLEPFSEHNPPFLLSLAAHGGARS